MTGGWGISPEEQPEFDDIFAVALTLGIRNRKEKAEKVAKLLDWGTTAIKPLLYTVECYIAISSSTDDQIDKIGIGCYRSNRPKSHSNSY